MKIISRSEWTATYPKPNIGAEDLDGTPYFRDKEVTGISFFIPNESVLFVELNPTFYLETSRKVDFSKRGFGDISYNLAVAPNVKGIFCLRGLCNKSSAHKDRLNNSTNVAVLTLIGNEEPPTDLLLQNLINARKLITSRFPNITTENTSISTLPFKDFWDEPVPKESSQFTCGLPNVFFLSEPDVPVEASVHVFDLIEQLAFWGYYRGRNDGVYGPLTRNAVMELQADLQDGNLYLKRIDGKYGRYTREAWCLYIKQLTT